MSKANAAPFFFSWRYLPFFITQITGSLTDNFFKQALLLFIAYKLSFAPDAVRLDVNFYNNLAAMIMILPFFLFSVLAGQLGEKFSKHILLRIIKSVEVLIVIIASVGFWQNNLWLLFAALFAMGMHSTFLGPVKYAILPQILPYKQLLLANSYLETGTYLSIVLSTVLAGVILSGQNFYFWLISCFLVCALTGCIASFLVPKQEPADTGLKLRFNVFTQTYRLLKSSFFERNKIIRYAIIFCSYFWLLGVLYTTQLPNFVKIYLGGGELTTTFLLLCFSAGLAFGTMLCHKLSNGSVEIATITVGAGLFTVFSLLLWWHTPVIGTVAQQTSWAQVLDNWTIQKIVIDLFFIGAGGGLFLVPLNVLLQVKAGSTERSQIISANYIVNSAFMVIASVLAIVILNVFWLSIKTLFLLTFYLNLTVLLTLLVLTRYYMVRYLVALAVAVIWRVKIVGEQQNVQRLPTVLLVDNRSNKDALLLSSAFAQPIKYIMTEQQYRGSFWRWMIKRLKTKYIRSRSGSLAAGDNIFALNQNYLLACFWNCAADELAELAQKKDKLLNYIKAHNCKVVPVTIVNNRVQQRRVQVCLGEALPLDAAATVEDLDMRLKNFGAEYD